MIERTPEQLAIIEKALGFQPTGWPNWKPYCLRCSTMLRMEATPSGFRCSKCRNEIGFDLCRLDPPVPVRRQP